MDDRERLPDDVVSWIEAVGGGELVGATRVPGGATREAWFVDVEGSAVPIFLRYSPSPMPPGSAFHPLALEAEVMMALRGAGLRVPNVIAVHPAREAVLSERVPGATWFYRITDTDEQVSVARDFVRQLAHLHRTDPATLDIPGLGPILDQQQLVLERIEDVRRRGTAPDGSIDPLLRLTTDWLEEHVPEDDGRVVLVQGDTGPGNFMYDGGKVTAVVDWELAHWGDPMDDIAWLSLRTVQDTFTHLPDRLREYEELSGVPIDPDRVWYYRVFAEASMATLRPIGPTPEPSDVAQIPVGRDLGNGIIYRQLHRRLWLEALAQVVDVDLPMPALPSTEPEPAEWHAWYGDILDVLGVVVPKVSDPLAAQWLKGIARMVKYLEQLDASGRAGDELERRDLAELLGSAPGPLRRLRADAAAAAGAGKVGDDAYVQVLWNKMQRDDYLMRTASGALRDRTWPPLV